MGNLPSENAVRSDLTTSLRCGGIEGNDSPIGDMSVLQRPDKVHEPVADLPNPELNPLLNPILGKHLGRWAHVYFTTAPEKRDEALFALLDELKIEEGQSGQPTAATSDAEDQYTVAAYALVCPHCQVQQTRSQKYCGMCGALMPVHTQSTAAATNGAFGQAMLTTDYADSVVEEHYGASGVAGVTSPAAQREFTRANDTFAPTSLLFQPEPQQSAPTEGHSRQRPVDIDWLRERNHPAHKSKSWPRTVIYPLFGVALVCITGFIYLRGIKEPGSEGSAIKENPGASVQANRSLPVGSMTETGAVTSLRSVSELPNHAAEEPNHEPPIDVPQREPKAPPHKTVPDVTAIPPVENTQDGSIELTTAKDYLSGTKGQPDSATAAKLLWKAVAKQNGAALLLLSDLYASGDGVPKSCDQARLLLDAALRKSIPTADAKLRSLQKSCP